jgi:hypothetical protein
MKEPLVEYLRCPAKELGPPPPKTAKSNRLNPAGISVFYSALELDTCIAELRPPVGDHVISGEFRFTRSLQIMDFTKFSALPITESPFHPEYRTMRLRQKFLKQLVDEVSQPILPGDTNLDYIATQVIAEYLATRRDPTIDGMIYKSAQCPEGKNLVLFNHACKVTNKEIVEQKKSDVEKRSPMAGPTEMDNRKTSLEYVHDSTKIHEINAVVYSKKTVIMEIFDFDQRKEWDLEPT